jgi:TonB family C-terminal domain
MWRGGVSMPLSAALLALSLLSQQPSLSTATANCTGGVAGAVDLCLADREFAEAEASQAGPDRTRHLQASLDLYRKAASAANDEVTKIKALDAATRTLDAKHLNDPAALELTLRELIRIAPNDLQFMFRLSRVQEEQGELEAAEDMLLAAHRQQPQELAPYKMLAQFYARRATAISNQIAQAKGPSPTTTDIPGTPDKDGIYRVGGGVPPPQRTDIPRYPLEAKAAGVGGVVLAEVVVNERGAVADAKVIRSVPMLDEAALETVRQWRFRPSVVNGEPVPTRMIVTVTFAD